MNVPTAGAAGAFPGGEFGRAAPEAGPVPDAMPVLSEGGRAADGRNYSAHHSQEAQGCPPRGSPRGV